MAKKYLNCAHEGACVCAWVCVVRGCVGVCVHEGVCMSVRVWHECEGVRVCMSVRVCVCA